MLCHLCDTLGCTLSTGHGVEVDRWRLDSGDDSHNMLLTVEDTSLYCCFSFYLCPGHRNRAAASKKLTLPRSPVAVPVAALWGGLDVLIHAKEIGGIVLALDSRKAFVVVPV